MTEVHPDEGDQYVIAEKAEGKEQIHLDYDYLLIATGPKLNFEATPGLGPQGGHTFSICSLPHTIQARDKYIEIVERIRNGEHLKMVIGTGHPGATCQGAAFEYILNIHKDLVKKGLRDQADLLWISNERDLGDFGVRGLQVRKRGQVCSSKEFIEAIFKDHGITWQVQTGVQKVDETRSIGKITPVNMAMHPTILPCSSPNSSGSPSNILGKMALISRIKSSPIPGWCWSMGSMGWIMMC